ncbi:hypothetical protein [Rhodococcus coprophilus]|uniref:Uncharacterized protein n=1 Tax=Rhodococcus coprophilus TaxID=38310 RepID=A0A2X4U2T3_9NOCA|nr:hypothetical protein [Rhodococcus coprophilus]MBM7458581.1 hypothetical protein [Rhodococcus coprophilus]SQI32939.1 Uncharacterised protein [Rhodococcus coprophilus]
MNTTATARLGEIETSASGIRFVRPLGNQAAKLVPNKVDKWRRENPDHVYRQEVTSTGGAWVQFWGFRVYYGPCADCGGLVHTRRKISHKKDGSTDTARWPKYCTECSEARHVAHNAAAKERMAALRKRRKEAMQERYPGWNPQPGRPKGSRNGTGTSAGEPHGSWIRTVPNMSYIA